MTGQMISERLNWSQTEAEQAINELQNCSKLTDNIYYLEPIISKSRNDRLEFMKDLLINGLRSKSLSERVSFMSKILNIDGSFRALALINAYDYMKSSRADQQIKILYPNDKKSFIYWKLSGIDIQLGQTSTRDFPIKHADPKFLSYESANVTLNFLKSESPSSIDMDSFVSHLFENVGLTAFNLSIIRDYFTELSYDSYKSRESLISYLSIINDKFLARATLNTRKYWLIYILIEELHNRNYGIRRSFRESQNLLGEKKHTVQRRYYQMKKIAQEKNLTIYDIINNYGLGQALYDLIIKLV